MKIIFQRHGESKYNNENMFTGTLDIDLSDVGVKQGKLAANYIVNNYKIDKIYSSSLARARNTAMFTAKELNIDIIVKEGLIEYCGGDWEGMKLNDIKLKYPDQYDQWKYDLSKVNIQNAQSMPDFYKIKVKAFDEILRENKGFNGTILIVSHVLALKCIICYITKHDVSYLKDIDYFPNASIFDFDYDETTNQFTNNKWGYADYLENLITSTYNDWKSQ